MKRGLLGVFLLSCCLGGVLAAEKPLRVVTTFLPAFSFASNVAGEAAQVENLLPGSVSLHDYQLSPGDVRKLSRADLIVVNGLGMETFLDRAIAATGPKTAAKIIALSDGLEAELIEETEPPHQHEPGHDHGHNPHIWLDPRLAMRSVTNILKAFQSRDPENAAVYAKNTASYIEKLRALDTELEQALGPVRKVPFVTYHNAFPYFVRRYGLNQAGVVEQVPEVAPSPKELSRLLGVIREKKVKALFTEPGASRLARQIARDTGITLAELDPLETGPLTPGSYEDGMRKNVQTLTRTLLP